MLEDHAAQQHEAAGGPRSSNGGPRDHVQQGPCLETHRSIADPVRFEEGLMALQAVVGRTVAANAHIRMRVSSDSSTHAGRHIKWLPENGSGVPRAFSRDDTLPENAYSFYGAGMSPFVSESRARPHGRTRKTCCGVVKGRKKLFFAGVALLTALAGSWFVWQRVLSSRSSASSNDGPVLDADNHSPTETTTTTTTHSPTTQHTAIVLPAPASSSASSPKPHVDRHPAGPVGSPSFLPSSSSNSPSHPPHHDPPPGRPTSGSSSTPSQQVFFGSFFI